MVQRITDILDEDQRELELQLELAATELDAVEWDRAAEYLRLIVAEGMHGTQAYQRAIISTGDLNLKRARFHIALAKLNRQEAP